MYMYATCVDCEIRYIGSTKLNNVPYISATVISRSASVTKIKDLNAQIYGGKQISNLKQLRL